MKEHPYSCFSLLEWWMTHFFFIILFTMRYCSFFNWRRVLLTLSHSQETRTPWLQGVLCLPSRPQDPSPGIPLPPPLVPPCGEALPYPGIDVIPLCVTLIYFYVLYYPNSCFNKIRSSMSCYLEKNSANYLWLIPGHSCNRMSMGEIGFGGGRQVQGLTRLSLQTAPNPLCSFPFWVGWLVLNYVLQTTKALKKSFSSF